MLSYEEIKKEMENRGADTTYFSRSFFETFLDEYFERNFLDREGAYAKTRASEFVRKSQGALRLFHSIFNEKCVWFRIEIVPDVTGNKTNDLAGKVCVISDRFADKESAEKTAERKSLELTGEGGNYYIEPLEKGYYEFS